MKALYRRIKYRHIGLYASKVFYPYIIQLSDCVYIVVPYKTFVISGRGYTKLGYYEVL